MNNFKIEIAEVLKRTVEIKANNLDEALSKVKEQYNNEEIVLGSEDYSETEISSSFSNLEIKATLDDVEFMEFILKKSGKMLSNLTTEDMIKLSFGDVNDAINDFTNQ